jgi:hypothetical protein
MLPNSLDEWEERLRPQVAEVDLLGEISLSEDEIHLLGRLIGDLIRQHRWKQAARLLRERYPCSYAVFLVAQGVRGYEAGDFWSAIQEATDLSIPSNQILQWGLFEEIVQTDRVQAQRTNMLDRGQWGHLFEEIVQTLPVAQFPPLGGHRYIGPILAHGGIPDYCLADFFDHFLHPLVTRPEYASLSVEEFIQRRLLQAGVVAQTDKPVLRFLEYGGALAVDFVERCREMALAWAERGEIPSPETVGLPPRVVQGYQDWLEGRARPSFRRRALYRSPVLFLDPWGWGPALHLPSQPVPAPASDVQALWRVSLSTEPDIPVDIRRDEMDWKTVPHTFPLPCPAPEYQVALIFAWTDKGGSPSEETQREWRIPGIQEECPLMWFDVKDGRLLTSQGTLPARRLWLLRHPDVVLETEPPEALRVTEQFPRMPGEWSDWVGEEVDLTQAKGLIVHYGNQQEQKYVVLKPEDQPALVGGQRLPVDDNRPPFYVGVPPSLRIPLPPTPRLHRWYVEIRNEWPALPPAQFSFTLADRQPDIEAGAALLDLREWLGEEPMGTYKVKVRGPLGHKADLAFRILPALEIAGHDALYLPDETQEAILLVETDAQTKLTLQPGAADCRLKEENGGRLYEVTAGIARADFPLRFARPTEGEDNVYVPLSVPIRRLRWMLILERELAHTPEWRTTLLHLPLDALEQARERLLLVDLFGGTAGNLAVRLSLQDEEGTPLQEQEGRWRAGQPYLRFDIAAFLDTLRQSAALFATFHLAVRGLPQRGKVSYPVLRVARRFVVQEVRAESAQRGETVYLRLRWESPFRVRHRLVRLWPAWRPWEPPLEIPIPDEAGDEYTHAFPASQLVPGRYLLELTTQDPWVAAVTPSRPAPDDPAVTSILIPPDAVTQRLQQLQDLAAGGMSSFPLALETACLRLDTGQDTLAREAFQECFEHLDEAEIEHILALARLVSGDPDLDRPLRMKLAAARRIQRVLDALRQGTLAESLYREYLARLPRPSLWPAETCEILLGADDERVRIQAVQQLIGRKRPSGIRAVVQWLQEGQISDEDAISLIEDHLSWALESLKDALPHPAVIRVLEKLKRHYPDQVCDVMPHPGCWVRCVAGWGRLERIEAADGSSREFFLRSSPEPGLRLHVLLRAHDPSKAEKIVIDLEEGRVIFPEVEKVYTCTQCERFSSRDTRLVREEHTRAAHEGISPKFRYDNPSLRQSTSSLEFRATQPQQPWE